MKVKLKVKRTNPETGDDRLQQVRDRRAPRTSTLLDALIQVREYEDGTLALRCSCRSAICGSCSMRVDGRARLACRAKVIAHHPRRREPRDHRRADGQHAGDQGPRHRHGVVLVEDAPGRPVPAARGPGAGARVPRPERGDDRPDAHDELHHVRRLRQRLHGAGGRQELHRAGRAREGVPLRRRPARRPRARPAGEAQRVRRHLGLHALQHVRRGLPEGRRADEPHPAAARDGDRGRASRTTPAPATPTSSRSRSTTAAA